MLIFYVSQTCFKCTTKAAHFTATQSIQHTLSLEPRFIPTVEKMVVNLTAVRYQIVDFVNFLVCSRLCLVKHKQFVQNFECKSNAAYIERNDKSKKLTILQYRSEKRLVTEKVDNPHNPVQSIKKCHFVTFSEFVYNQRFYKCKPILELYIIDSCINTYTA